MLFHVAIEVSLPPEMPPEQRARLLAAELDRGVELRRGGVIRHIWRIPGAIRNVGIWDAADATELHAQISSLPLFPYARADVMALADHPVEAAAR
jgi:muconolactone D-isomerase